MYNLQIHMWQVTAAKRWAKIPKIKQVLIKTLLEGTDTRQVLMSTQQTTDDMFWIAYKMNLNIYNLSEFPI